MDFLKIKLTEWQQFGQIDISFHPRLTILTGSNGSGKTTILSLLARHRGYHQYSLATPKLSSSGQIMSYFSLPRNSVKRQNNDRLVGTITYTNYASATLVVPETGAAQYQVQIHNQQPTRVFYISSHKQIFLYRRIGSINTNRKEKSQVFEEVYHNYINRANGNNVEPHSFLMKGTMISWIIGGYGVKSDNRVLMPSDPVQIKNFEGFRDVLRLILPPNLRFEDIEVRDYEVVFVCNGGEDEFLLETASGGISALIDIAWQIYMFDTDSNDPFAVLIDEIENHLHPTMQRTILPNLLNAFPNAKFIVSTHSPLVVTSVEDSSVYALRYDERKKVNSHLLNLKHEVKNTVEILDEVLGVSTTMPAWAVNKLDAILGKHIRSIPTSDSLSNLRSELAAAGLGNMFPQAIAEIAEANK